MLGMDTKTGFSDAVLSQADFTALMAVPPARRAVALWQVGESEFVGPELNRAFVDNDERLDPAMAALARDLASPMSNCAPARKAWRSGMLLTGLFPVPPYQPEGGYHIDQFAGAGLCPHRKPLPERRDLAGGRARHHADDARHRQVLGGTGAADAALRSRLFAVAGPALYRRSCSTS